jgi:hypothetical protein
MMSEVVIWLLTNVDRHGSPVKKDKAPAADGDDKTTRMLFGL